MAHASLTEKHFAVIAVLEARVVASVAAIADELRITEDEAQDLLDDLEEAGFVSGRTEH